jgi:hypothetical protein
MSGSQISNERLDEYRRERRANLLRRRAQERTTTGEQVAQLGEAEANLSSSRRSRSEREAQTEAATQEKGLLTSVTRKPTDNMGAATTGIEVKVFLRMDQVPTSIAHLLDVARTPLVSISIVYTGGTFARLRLTTSVEGYSARAIDTIELIAGDKASTVVDQLPTFFPKLVEEVKERTRAMLHVQIDNLESDGVELHRSFPIWLLPRTTACLSVLDPKTDQATDLTSYLAAYVTPNAQPVMDVLREAADINPAHAMVGFQGAPEEMAETVRAQVAAIYQALRRRNIVYINSVICFGGGRTQLLQRVRLPRESLQHKSANCLDGTVLMASILEAASLEAAIVLVPGHAFLGFAIDENLEVWEYVETTMLGSNDFEDAHRRGAEEAAQYGALGDEDPNAFRALSISTLRTQFNILPME